MSSSTLTRRIGAQRPQHFSLPKTRRGSAGPDAIEYAESLGYELDDWQRWCIDGILSEDENLRLCATIVALLVSRQNGKNVVLEVVELFAFYVLGWRIVHSAHRQETSTDHMAQLRSVIEANPELNDITTITVANGKEKITRTDTREEIRFVTRSKKIGRGKSPRMYVFDEALYLTDDQMQAMVPSMSAQSLSDDAPIMIFTSSAPVAESQVLHRVRTECIKGLDDAFYADWGCPPGTDPLDREAWYLSNPGLGIRISERWIEQNELRLLTPEAFAIERLGIVADVDQGSGVIASSAWAACLDAASVIVEPLVLVVDVSPERSWTSFAVAGRRADGIAHVEIVERRPGTGWVLDVARALHSSLGLPVTLDKNSPAAGLIAALVAQGTPVTEVGTADVLRSCAAFQDAVMNARVRHIGQDPLDAAVSNADIRPVGESWLWSRKASSIDITALVSVTVAFGAMGASRETTQAPMFAMS